MLPALTSLCRGRSSSAVCDSTSSSDSQFRKLVARVSELEINMANGIASNEDVINVNSHQSVARLVVDGILIDDHQHAHRHEPAVATKQCDIDELVVCCTQVALVLINDKVKCRGLYYMMFILFCVQYRLFTMSCIEHTYF